MFLHSGQTIITTPFSYECLVNVLVDRVSQTVHLYITQQCIDGGAVFERREGGREGGREGEEVYRHAMSTSAEF